MPAQTNQNGLDENMASALSYVLGPITGIVFLITDKRKRVRFNALQSIIVFTALFILQTLLSVTIILAILAPLLGIAGFILWLVLIFKSYQGEDLEVPVACDYAKKWAK